MPSQWSVPLPYPGGLLVYAMIIAAELMIGLVLGLGITVMIGGMQTAGDLMSRVGGLTLADVLDPTTQASVPLFSQFLGLLSTAVFIIIGGHRMLMGGLLDTFKTIPPGGCLATFLGPAGSSPEAAEVTCRSCSWCWSPRAFTSASAPGRRW